MQPEGLRPGKLLLRLETILFRVSCACILEGLGSEVRELLVVCYPKSHDHIL
jgi:hypothetical protein